MSEKEEWESVPNILYRPDPQICPSQTELPLSDYLNCHPDHRYSYYASNDIRKLGIIPDIRCRHMGFSFLCPSEQVGDAVIKQYTPINDIGLTALIYSYHMIHKLEKQIEDLKKEIEVMKGTKTGWF